MVAIAPGPSHTPVIYPIAILKNSRNPNAAKAFLQFLNSTEAKAIFRQYRYEIPEN
jgi:molybdate transport system substrate-binding protein